MRGRAIKAGSKAAFRRVDYDYPVGIAEMALRAGARHFVLVTAMSSNRRSPFFYSRVKGEVEAAIDGLGYPAYTIVRPSVIAGSRQEPRLGEALALKLLRFAPKAVRPVHARDIASAMVSAARADPLGKRIILSKSIRRE